MKTNLNTPESLDNIRNHFERDMKISYWLQVTCIVLIAGSVGMLVISFWGF